MFFMKPTAYPNVHVDSSLNVRIMFEFTEFGKYVNEPVKVSFFVQNRLFVGFCLAKFGQDISTLTNVYCRIVILCQ